MTEQPRSNALKDIAPKLYNISDTSFSEADLKRKIRNWFLLSGIGVEAGLSMAMLTRPDIHPALLVIGGLALTLTGGTELERRVELHTANKIQKGAQEIQDINLLINPKWEE